MARRGYPRPVPSQAYALVATFVVISVVLGFVGVRVVARAGGPTALRSYLLPIVAAFLAFYLIGHRLGISVGPEFPLYGFRVALLGDVAIGLGAALVVALVQALLVGRRLVR